VLRRARTRARSIEPCTGPGRVRSRPENRRVRLPSYRYTALADLTDDELRALLAEDETLFGEHKSGLGQDEAFQLVKAVASFANGFGGWVLLGVKDCRPSGWEPPSGPLVDAVRQRLEGRIDPVPPFAAASRQIDGKTVGVVRVHESSDTPHVVTQNGGVYVREVAQDKEHGKRAYRPQGVSSQYVLQQLAQRGEVAAERAERRLAPYACPFIDDVLDLRYDYDAKQRLIHVPRQPAVVVRVAPLTVTPRFAEWAVSEEAQDACVDVASADRWRQGLRRARPAARSRAGVRCHRRPRGLAADDGQHPATEAGDRRRRRCRRRGRAVDIRPTG
jgi:Putative DNA-binding domain